MYNAILSSDGYNIFKSPVPFLLSLYEYPSLLGFFKSNSFNALVSSRFKLLISILSVNLNADTLFILTLGAL